MVQITFLAGENSRFGYLAVPSSGSGAGILVLHAWWGLTPFFTRLCDRLAEEGFVAFAPDLHHGKTAATIEEAKQILAERDSAASEETALAAMDFLQRHEAVTGTKVGAIGFSMGAQTAVELHTHMPDALFAAILFYGPSPVAIQEYYGEKAAALFHGSNPLAMGHYGETDEWEPVEEVRQAAENSPNIFVYPNTGHWFFEDDRPEHFHAQSAALSWERTLQFLREKAV